MTVLLLVALAGCGNASMRAATDKGIASFSVAYESAIESARISLTTLGADFKITNYEDNKGQLFCDMPVAIGLVKLFGKQGAKKLVFCKCQAEKRFATPSLDEMKEAWGNWSFFLKDSKLAFDNDLLAYYFASAQKVGLTPKTWLDSLPNDIPETPMTLAEKNVEREILSANLAGFGERLDLVIADLVRDGVSAEMIAAFKQTKEDMIKQLKVYSMPTDGPTRTKAPFRVLVQEYIVPAYSDLFSAVPDVP